MCQTLLITIHDAAIPCLNELNKELSPKLQAHPVPQSDPRAKGLIRQFTKDAAATVLADMPVLYSVIFPQLHDEATYFLAANQTPPTHHDDFAMRPHGFSRETPLWTTVMFLKFPLLCEGGELVIFENTDELQMSYLDAMERRNGRNQLHGFKAQLLTPELGRVCRFPGHLPHAVLGYSESSDQTQRLSIVLAEFGN